MALLSSTSSEKKRLKKSSKQQFEDSNFWPGVIPPRELLGNILWESPEKKGEKGTLFVAKEYEKDPYLTSYRSQLSYNGNDFKQFVLDRDAFQARIKKSQSKSLSESAAQKHMQAIFKDAVKYHASDVHFDLNADFANIEFRINGLLQHGMKRSPQDAYSMIAATYNSMMIDRSAEQIFKAEEIQNGQIHPDYLPEEIHGVRLVRGPTSDGQYMVLRFHWKDDLNLEGMTFADRLRYLGYSEFHIACFLYFRSQPKGVVTLAGTTGSGKTTTLKHIMEANADDFSDLKSVSVEDPPEVPIKGVRQIPVVRSKNRSKNDNEQSTESKFAETLLSILRQDPDLIMVGEVRDHETVKLLVEATRTGHRVWTTVHTGSGFGIPDRYASLLRQAGDPDPMNTLCQQDVLLGLVHQCLVPVLCDCKEPLSDRFASLTPSEQQRLKRTFKEFDGIFLRKKDGCDHCLQTGIKGRTVVAEVIPMDGDLFEVMKRDGVDTARKKWVQRFAEDSEQYERFEFTLQGHARAKAREGQIDPLEAVRAVGPLVLDDVMADNILDYDEIMMWSDKAEFLTPLVEG